MEDRSGGSLGDLAESGVQGFLEAAHQQQHLEVVYFDFRPERLKDLDGDGFNEYYPAGIDTAPYVYFHNKTYASASILTRRRTRGMAV